MLSGNAAMARRLVRLSGIIDINLDPEIISLAKTNLLTDADFSAISLTQYERQAIQSLIDFGFRAILPSSNGKSAKVALAAAKIANVSPIFVMAHQSKKLWKSSLEEYEFTDYEIIEPSGKIDADLIRDRRHGLLIIEEGDILVTDEMSLLLKDFYKTVILSKRRLVSDLLSLVEHLFEGVPHEIISNVNPYFKKDLERKGFTTTRVEDMAFLFNIVTDMIAITKDETPNIDIDYTNLQREIELGHLRLG
jgi:hypothetical protein